MKLGRRAFLRLIPVVALAAVSGSWWFLTQTKRESNSASRSTSTSSNASATTSEAFVFPVTWNGDQPTEVNLNDYRLKVDGDVSTPLDLSAEQLYAISAVQRTVQLDCVEGWTAEVPWEGIPLSHLLSLAGAPLQNIADITVKGVTGYSTSVSPDMIPDLSNMIALKAGGFPLTVEHGYPARLVTPGRAGLYWVKYVERITCRTK